MSLGVLFVIFIKTEHRVDTDELTINKKKKNKLL